MQPTRLSLVVRIGISVAAIGLITAIYAAALRANPTTIALSYVVVILLVATRWGIAESTAASLAAILCFNFFFLPPVGTLTIADPQNWAALLAFLLTAAVTSQLSGRLKIRNVEAVSRQSELERLYVLSRSLLLIENTPSAPVTIARHIVDAFELQGVGIYDRRTDTTAWAGAQERCESGDRLREIARSGLPSDPGGFKMTVIRLGGDSVGSLGILGSISSETVLQAIANLAAIGLERARSQEATARAEAARHSSELRATVLDAVAHEFKTPLTAMKAAASELEASGAIGERERELAAILDEEIDRFQSLVTDAVQMLRIDAGDFVVHRNRHDLGRIVDATLQGFAQRLDGHELVRRIPPDQTVDADRGLLALALRQLVDNALKYSTPSSVIEIAAHSNGTVDITVRNTGSTIPEPERARVAERFYRGARAKNIPGTGMGLAIVQQIARAHGGTLSLNSSPDAGTAFTLSLPRGGVPQ